jgi:uncharacterized membrane protein
MISFAPLLPWPALYALGALAALATLPALILQASGAWLRLAGFTFLLITLAGPDWVTNTTKPVPSIVLLLTDHSQSMQLGNRAALAAQAASTLRTSAGAIDLRTIDIPPAEAGGTSLFAALQSALATIPTTQLAGIIAITDGEISDPPPAALPAPFTALLTARAEETDRELRLTNPPAYGLAGQTVPLTLTVLDHGASDTGQPAAVTITEDGIPIPTPPFIIGQAQTIPLPIPHAGPIIITATAALLPGEVSPLNNTTAFTLTGIRKRLNVLLISGHPSPAERTWRVLLKSDPAIRLIHFTILRLPDETLDAAPQDIALVPFPVEQLFNTDINKFDLIILDDFSAGGLLPPEDLENITNFVTNGGALLTEAGPEFESPDSLANSPLGPVVPATPLPDGTITQAFSPAITPTGTRHPVTAPFAGAPLAPWPSLQAATPTAGTVLMTGPNNLPLLILADAGKGRTGLLLSDQFWLWTKAAPHAGPALPLLRRIVHFLLREPALEPESLTAAISRGQLTIHLQTLNPIPPASAAVTTPDGTTTQRPWHQASPGQFIAQMPAAAPGLYRVTAGPFTAYAASAAANAAEYQDLAATAHILSPLAKNIIWLGSTPTPPLPTLITQRHATQITGTKKAPLLPPACSLLVALTLLIGAWWRESGARL